MKQACGCGRPMPGNRTLCAACHSDLTRALNDTPFYAAHLEVAFARLGVLGDNAGRRSADPVVPFHSPASSMAADLHTTLTHWATQLATPPKTPIYGPTCPPPCKHASCKAVRRTRPHGTRSADIARWLTLHLDQLHRRTDAYLMAADIIAITNAAARMIDRPADLVYAGPCDRCSTDLYARLSAPTVSCRMCNDRYDVDARRRWLLAEAEDTLAHAALIARALSRLGQEISVDRIYKWHERRQLLPHAYQARGERQIPLYRVGDVLELLHRASTDRDATPQHRKVAS